MDGYVGAATGCLKSVHLKDNTFLNLTDVKSLDPKEEEITTLQWKGFDQSEVVATLANRQLKCYNPLNASFKTMFNVSGGEGKVKGLYVMPESDRIVTGVESGEISIWDMDGTNTKTMKVKKERSLSALLCMSGNGDRLAVAGKEVFASLWDLERGKQTWIAKNVKNDWLDLRVPVRDADIRLMPDSNLIVTGTANGFVRLYDTRVQQKPVRMCEFVNHVISAISLCYRPNQVFVGTTKGELSLFDFRGRFYQLGAFKGQTGSIRCIDAHPTEPYVATCGIDRFARVHNVNTRKLESRIYCKARLNKILIRNDLSLLVKPKTEEDEDDEEKPIKERLQGSDGQSDSGSDDGLSDEDDELWNQMELGDVDGNEVKKEEVMSDVGSDVVEEDSDGEPVPKKKRVTSKKGQKKQVDGSVAVLKEEDDEELPLPKKKKAKKSTTKEDDTEVVEVKQEVELYPASTLSVSQPQKGKGKKAKKGSEVVEVPQEEETSQSGKKLKKKKKVVEEVTIKDEPDSDGEGGEIQLKRASTMRKKKKSQKNAT